MRKGRGVISYILYKSEKFESKTSHQSTSHQLAQSCLTLTNGQSRGGLACMVSQSPRKLTHPYPAAGQLRSRAAEYTPDRGRIRLGSPARFCLHHYDCDTLSGSHNSSAHVHNVFTPNRISICMYSQFPTCPFRAASRKPLGTPRTSEDRFEAHRFIPAAAVLAVCGQVCQETPRACRSRACSSTASLLFELACQITYLSQVGWLTGISSLPQREASVINRRSSAAQCDELPLWTR